MNAGTVSPRLVETNNNNKNNKEDDGSACVRAEDSSFGGATESWCDVDGVILQKFLKFTENGKNTLQMTGRYFYYFNECWTFSINKEP